MAKERRGQETQEELVRLQIEHEYRVKAVGAQSQKLNSLTKVWRVCVCVVRIVASRVTHRKLK